MFAIKGSYRFDRLSIYCVVIYCVVIYCFKVFIFVEPRNDISFLKKSIIKISSRLKLFFPYAILKKLKHLLFPSITCKKAHIHDTSRNFREKKKTGKIRLV